MTFVESFIALLHGVKAHFSKHNFSALKQIFLVVDQVKAMQECQHVLRDWIQMTQVCKLQILLSTGEEQYNESNY